MGEASGGSGSESEEGDESEPLLKYQRLQVSWACSGWVGGTRARCRGLTRKLEFFRFSLYFLLLLLLLASRRGRWIGACLGLSRVLRHSCFEMPSRRPLAIQARQLSSGIA